MEDIDRVLRQPEHNNLVIEGEPEFTRGLIENIAFKIIQARKEKKENLLPLSFQGAEILKFNLSAILGDLAQFGKYEKTMRDLARDIVNAAEAANKKHIFCFNFQDVSWIHDQRLDLVAGISTLFKYVLEETKVPVIGLASKKYYQRFFVEKEDNKELRRYFSRISLEPFKLADVQMLLRNHFIRIAQFYKSIFVQEIRISMDMNEDLRKVLKIMDESFQGYSIAGILLELMDEVITEKVYAQVNGNLDRENSRERIIRLGREIKLARESGNRQLDVFLGKALAKCLKQRGKPAYLLEAPEGVKEITITFNEIAAKIAAMKKVPVEILTQTKEKKLEGLIPALKSRVVGQDAAIEEIFRKFQEKARNLSDRSLPFGCFIGLGPTGVGKT